MSKAACLKKTLCDGSVPPAERMVNVNKFLDVWIETTLSTDPSEAINYKDKINQIMLPHLASAEADIAQFIDDSQ